MTRHDAAKIARFLLVGVGNTSLGLAVIFVALKLGANDIAANATGYGVGLLFSFLVNRSWTFRHSGDPVIAFSRFLLVFAAAYAANLATTLALRPLLGEGSFLAQAAGVIPYTVLFYLGSHFLVFQEGSRHDASPDRL